MIKIMFKPFFKKFLGLFVSMVFISALSIGLLVAFSSTILNLQKTYKDYLNNYENIDGLVKTDFTKREELLALKEVEGVKDIDFRMTMDCRFLTNSGRNITARILTFQDEDTGIFHRYIIEQTTKSTEYPNVSVVRKFAKNNSIKTGDVIQVGYFNMYIKLYVNEIIETPEAIQVRANDYVWSDNTDFGYIYISEDELNTSLYQLSLKIDEALNESEDYKYYYAAAQMVTGIDVPDLADKAFIGNDFASKYSNQILIQANEGVSEAQVVQNVSNYLTENGHKVKETRQAHQLIYIIYLENCIKQLRVASIFLPVFFYFVTMVIIILFMNQIIKAMTKEIGIMMSVGVGFKDIRSIFILFTLIMSVVASVIGVGIGYFMTYRLTTVMIDIYSMPTIPQTINPYSSAAACLFLFVFAEIATLISCLGILHITPKDATISNEAKRKKTPKAVARLVEKAPMVIKLGVNSIFQNLRRFFVSVFSIFAAFIIIILSLYFYVSKTELMDQSINRRLNFDCQVYATEVLTEEKIEEIRQLDCGVTALEDCYYTYLQASTGEKSLYIECLAYDPNTSNDLVQIPNQKGRGSIKLADGGIILPVTTSKQLGVNVGDTIKINDADVKVIALSKQYFHPIAYLSKAEMNKITTAYVSSIVLNVNDQEKFLMELDDTVFGSLTVFTENLNKDISMTFNSVDIFIYIMIAFSLGMSFIILAIMSQNALMEQQRPITVYRAIGFSVMNVSNLWTLQSVSQLLLSTIVAFPAGVLVSKILFTLCSSVNQMYPLIISVRYALYAFLFILVIIFLTHTLAMLSIKRWNIANNTRSRE